MKIDVRLTDSAADAPSRAAQLESLDVDGAFTFESAHDLFLPLAAAAPTTTLDLYTNVAIAFPRSPMHLAQTANDLQLLSSGRFRLGLGTQVRAHVEKRFGSTWERPVDKMREWVLATTAILDHWNEGSPLRFEGEFTRHTLMTPAFHPGPNPFGRPPVWVGALGPRMTAMAAEVADGILVMPFNSARHLEAVTLPAIERGLQRAGRTRNDIDIVAEIIVGVGRTDEELATARIITGILGFYGSTPAYRGVLDAEGWADLHPELNRLSKRGDWVSMMGLITDEMIHTLAVYGSPRQCAAAIAERYRGIADRVCLYFPGYEIDDGLLGETVAEVRSAMT
ncbi:MAG: TIGR03617 family F420-dependent LLM class oxidoreductase [Actinobacteria bacterium]|nr:TIGR03617 family F420-dependent LLM class oxidoreductase [Actinomycetota bacterium]